MNQKHDSLKALVNQHREEFEPTPEGLDTLWPDISDRLDEVEGSKTKEVPWLRIAAAILLLMAAGLSWYQWPQQEENIDLATVAPELAESQLYYGQLISQQMELLQSEKSKVDPEVLEDITLIDRDLEVLMQDLRDGADSEEVVMAIIQLYRTKLMMLTEILNEIQEEKSKESDHDTVII